MIERKLRHILDVACITFHVHVPKLYRGDIVLIACYLINKMPSLVINNPFPISCLSHDAILFHITPYIFCCTCFEHVLGMDLDKLSPCTIRCIFLGYSYTQKVYRGYDSITHKQYVSVDVTFFKDTPYFSSEGSDFT